MTIEINIKRATILTIAKTIIKLILRYEEKNIMFMAKKVVTLANIQIRSNEKQKNFGDKTENSMEIKVNTTYF